MKNKYKVGIIGCGKIFERHVESIRENSSFSLKALCDSDSRVRESLSGKYTIPIYKDYKQMIEDEDINFIAICSPNALHYEQAKHCLENACDVLIEKPVTLNPSLARELAEIAKENKRNAYSVLQVRLNPAVTAVKKLLSNNILGQVRGVSLTQRWQRPSEYFADWRGDPSLGGGTLHECGIHYLDILCYLFGRPSARAASLYNTKHKKTRIEDTIYSILDFGQFGGTAEVTISTEPSNIECSIAIVAERGFIRLGGKGLDKIVEVKLPENSLKIKEEYDKITLDLDSARRPNSYGKYSGSCPNHPELYSRLAEFDISTSFDSLELIQDIYRQCGVNYSE